MTARHRRISRHHRRRRLLASWGLAGDSVTRGWLGDSVTPGVTKSPSHLHPWRPFGGCPCTWGRPSTPQNGPRWEWCFLIAAPQSGQSGVPDPYPPHPPMTHAPFHAPSPSAGPRKQILGRGWSTLRGMPSLPGWPFIPERGAPRRSRAVKKSPQKPQSLRRRSSRTRPPRSHRQGKNA